MESKGPLITSGQFRVTWKLRLANLYKTAYDQRTGLAGPDYYRWFYFSFVENGYLSPYLADFFVRHDFIVESEESRLALIELLKDITEVYEYEPTKIRSPKITTPKVWV